MTFAVNGNALQTPEPHQWVIPPSYGTSLAGRPLYPGVFAYELNWPMLSQTEFNLLVSMSQTGSVVSSLPRWHGVASDPDPYEYYNYSGTYLGLPTYQSYFEGYYKSVKLLVNNVTV